MTTPNRTLRVVTIVSWLALVVFVVASLGGSLLGRSTFLATDIMTGRMAPWVNTEGVGVLGADHPLGAANPFAQDTIDQWTPAAYQFGRELHEGRIQQWNPFQSGGIEGSGLPTSGVWSPLSLPWLLFPGPFAPAAVKVLEALTVTLGMSLLLRRWRLPQATWPLASLVYLSSGLMVAWTNWPQTRVAACVPLFFWAVDRAVTQRTWWNVPLVGAMFALLFLGGFPSLAVFTLYAGGFYVLARMFWHRGWRERLTAVGRALAGVVAGAAMSAFMLLPFLYNALTILDFTGRQQGPDSHLHWSAIATMLVPDVLGEADGTGYWSFTNPVERFSYLGVAVIVLVAVAALTASRRRLDLTPAVFAVTATAVLMIVIYLGGPLLRVAQRLPFLGTNPINRMIMLIGFFVAVLAAFGFASLVWRLESPDDVAPSVDVSPHPRPAERTIRVALALATLAVPLVVLGGVVYGAEATREIVRHLLPLPLAYGIVAVVAAAVALRTSRRGLVVTACVAVVAVVTVPAIGVTRAWWPRNPVGSFYAGTPTTDFLAEHLGGDRFAHAGQAMLPGTSTVYGLRALQGRGFMSDEWGALMLAADPGSRQDDWMWTLNEDNLATSLTSGVLDRLATRYVVMDINSPLPGALEQTGEIVRSVSVEPGTPLTSGPQTGPVRSIRVENQIAAFAGPDGMTATLTLTGTDGREVATTSSWFGYVWGELDFPIAGEAIGATEGWTATLRLDGLATPIDVGADAEGAMVMTLTRPSDDGFAIVHTGDAVVLERPTALPRIRWASRELVITDAAARIAAMADPDTPSDAVVLEDPADAHGVDGTATATVTDRSVGTDTITVDVEATGQGWLVVADSLRRGGWTATVDGEPVPIADAEHAAGAVLIRSAGRHVVELSYEAPWLRAGTAVTGGTAAMLALAGVGTAVRRRRQAA